MAERMDLRDFQYSNETIGSPHGGRSIKHEHYTFHLLDYQDKLRVRKFEKNKLRGFVFQKPHLSRLLLNEK